MYIHRVFPTGEMGRDIKWGLLAQFRTKPTFCSNIFTAYLQLLCPAQSTLVLSIINTRLCKFLRFFYRR